MTTRRTSGLFASLLWLAASGASAGTLTAASWTQTVQGWTPEGHTFSRTAAQLGATGTSTASSIAVSLSFPQTTVRFFVPKTTMFPVSHVVSITQGGPQAITATPSMASGTPGIPGTVLVMTAQHLAKGVNQSRWLVGVNTEVQIPLSIGNAGQETGTFIVIGITRTRTVDFYAWTPGTLSFASLTLLGYSLPSVVAMGTFNLTAMGGGTVTLVSPSKISIDNFVSQRRTVSLATLKLSFVPEPGALLLLAAAGAALALHGARSGRVRR